MLYSYLSDNISAFSALLVGLAAVASFLLALHQAKQRAKDECDDRIDELRLAFLEGVKYERRRDS